MSTYYFDHAASAPRRVEVTQAMAPWMHGVVGNPAGTHRAARLARRAIEDARDEIAALTAAKPGNVVFTAGGTESCTLAIAGVVRTHSRQHERSRIVISPIEHHAVLDAAAMVARQLDNVDVTTLRVDGDGVLDLSSLHEALEQPNVAVVSVMMANNETGVVQPVDAAAAMAQAAGVVSHSDVVAAAPWMDLSVVGASVDMISLCAHKLGGPVNAGALVLRRDITMDALAPGGGQEKGRRGGTVDVAAAVGLATALRLAAQDREATVRRVTALRDTLIAGVSDLGDVAVTGSAAVRLPGTVHLTFPGIASDELLFVLDEAGVCASAAAACSSGAVVASHVLDAMGMDPARARGSLRLSFGAETTSEDIAAVTALLRSAVTHLRADA